MKTNHFRHCLAVIAGLSLTACASSHPRQQPVWNATPSATVPKERAVAKCEYDLMQNRAAFDNLSVLAGRPTLNNYGQNLYQMCMLSQGYQFGGMVSAQATAS